MRLVIFDIDGTLLNSRASILRQWRTLFVRHGLPVPSDEAILSVIGLSLAPAIAALTGTVDEDQVAEMRATFRAIVTDERRRGVENDVLFAGAREVIDALASEDDVVLGIATGKAMRGIRHVLDVHDLNDRFRTLQAADVAPSKPHPGMVLQAMAETGADPCMTVMIGDSVYDMQMARSAGVGAIGVSWGYHDAGALSQSGAMAVIDRFDDLPQQLELIWAVGRDRSPQRPAVVR